MSDMFDEDEDDLIETELFCSDDDLDVNVSVTPASEGSTLDARRRLESMLEEKRLRAELLDDFLDD